MTFKCQELRVKTHYFFWHSYRLEFARLNDLVYVHYNIRLRVRQIESPMDPDAISLDNIDVLSPWRVESEEPILEESPSWLEPVADDPLE